MGRTDFRIKDRAHFFRKGVSLASASALALALGFGGCAVVPDAKPTTGRNPTVAEVPNPDETVRGEDDPPIVTLELGSSLHEHRLVEGDQLPANIVIPTTNLNGVPVTAALQAVLQGTDVSLSWDASTFDDHLATVMNLSGSLPQVVEKICSSAKVFCTYRQGSLELSDKETFVIGIPPAAQKMAETQSSVSVGATGIGNGGVSPGGISSGPNGSSGIGGGGIPSSTGVSSMSAAGNSMIDAISDLAGGKVKVDDQGGNIIYTTDVEGENRVRAYLEQLRNGRPLIVLQMYVWEVTLNKENSEGINWSEFRLSDLGPGFSKLALASSSAMSSVVTGQGFSGGPVSIGAVTTGRLNTASLISFLSTQGQVQTISSPQVTFVSGSSAELRVGGTQNYVQSVGQLVSATNVSGTTNANSTTGIGTNTVSPGTINTGLLVDVAGSYENGIILANLNLSLTNLVQLQQFNAGGGTIIQLPQTTDREISTAIRVRPGDNLVMAGMVTSADTNNSQGLPLPDDSQASLYGDTQRTNNELVIVVKPSVILFSDRNEKLAAQQKEQAQPLPAAVVIDKDGAKTLNMPNAQNTPSAPAANETAAATAEPEPSAGQPAPDDNEPVNRMLMQRGFSHAFDQLLQPSASLPKSASEGNGNQP